MIEAERVALRRRYAEERDKRLRPDGNDQYLEFTGRFSRLLDDPYAPRAERDPKRDHVTVAFVGGGFAGLVTGARLREAGVEDVRIVEKAGGFGGTWPAAIWHTYGENMFLPLGVEPFQPPVFTGSQWNLVPPGLRQVAKPHKKHHDPGGPILPPGIPFPVYTPPGGPTFPPQFGGGGPPAVNAAAAGVAVGGVSAALPCAFPWVRRRTRRRGRGTGQHSGRG